MNIGTLSSPGVGSGLDVNSIVSQLMALERRPLTLLLQDKSKLDAQLSAYGRLQSSLSAVGDAARKLGDPALWSSSRVSSSDAAAVSAMASGGAASGNYRVEVAALASKQTVTGAPFPSPVSVVGTGMLTIELGQWFSNPPDFTPNAGASAVSITIGPGDDTMEKIRDRINAAGAGVSASIVTDASGARLSLSSTETGQTRGFRIAVTDDDGDNGDAAGLSTLAFDAAGGPSRMTQTQSAANARLSINGIDIDSPGNTLKQVLDGLTLQISRVTTAPVDLSVERDTGAIKQAVTGFAAAYNDMVKLLREQTAYNAEAKSAGLLQGDRTAVGLLDKLRGLVGSNSGASTAFSRLSDIGLDPQRDGKLEVDGAKLDQALGQLDQLKPFFARDDVGEANDGFATLLRQFADLSVGTDGSVSTRQEGLRSRIDKIDRRAAAFEDRMAMTEKRLRDQYTRLDTNMAALTSLQAYVAQQVTLWNKNTA